MRNLTCEDCYFYHVCSDPVCCDDYAALNSDTYLDEYIEEKRMEFRRQWFDYVDSFCS